MATEILSIFEGLLKNGGFKFSSEDSEILCNTIKNYGYGTGDSGFELPKNIGKHIKKCNGKTKVCNTSNGRFNHLVQILEGLKYSNANKVALDIATKGRVISIDKLQKLSSENSTEVGAAIHYLAFIQKLQQKYAMSIKRAILAADFKFGNPFMYVKRASEVGILNAENDVAEIIPNDVVLAANGSIGKNLVEDAVNIMRGGIHIESDNISIDFHITDGFISDLFNSIPYYLSADIASILSHTVAGMQAQLHRFTKSGNIAIEPVANSDLCAIFSGNNSYLQVGMCFHVTGNLIDTTGMTATIDTNIYIMDITNLVDEVIKNT